MVAKQYIDKLLNKGISFNLISQQEVINYLEYNNYFKLTSYIKNFPTIIVEDKRIYPNLDFKHLIELSQMDMLLRYLLVKMCLDIEHSLKVNLMNIIEKDENEDEYSIVDDYVNSLNEVDKCRLLNEIKRNANTIYYN